MTQLSFRDEVETILDIRANKSFVRTENGMLAGHRPDIAEFAYDIKLNDPLSATDAAKIAKLAPPKSKGTVSKLYTAFNGLNIGMSRLAVNGMVGLLERSDIYSIQNVPFDIESYAVFDRPEFAPVDGLVIGHSDTLNQPRLFHVILPDCGVAVGAFETIANPVRAYDSIRNWLFSELRIAMASH